MNTQNEKEITPIKILKSKPGSKNGKNSQKRRSQILPSEIKVYNQVRKSEKETELESGDNITNLFFSKKNKSSSPCKKCLKFKDLIVESKDEEDDCNLELPLSIKLGKRRYSAINPKITEGQIIILKNIAKKEQNEKIDNAIDKNKIIVEEKTKTTLSDLKSKFFCCL